MTGKKNEPESRSDDGSKAVESVANPKGGARRRLLRAIGGSSGAVLGAVITSKWHKPMVEAIVLPAHAQTSPVENCLVTLAGQYLRGSSEDYSISLFVSDTILASVTGGFSSASLSGASTFPPGSYPVGMSVAQASSQPFSASLSISCCDTTVSAAGGAFAFEGAISIVLTISDDGECSLPTKDGP